MGAIAEPLLGVSPLFLVSFHPLSGCAEEEESLLFLVSNLGKGSLPQAKGGNLVADRSTAE